MANRADLITYQVSHHKVGSDLCSLESCSLHAAAYAAAIMHVTMRLMIMSTPVILLLVVTVDKPTREGCFMTDNEPASLVDGCLHSLHIPRHQRPQVNDVTCDAM